MRKLLILICLSLVAFSINAQNFKNDMASNIARTLSTTAILDYVVINDTVENTEVTSYRLQHEIYIHCISSIADLSLIKLDVSNIIKSIIRESADFSKCLTPWTLSDKGSYYSNWFLNGHLITIMCTSDNYIVICNYHK